MQALVLISVIHERGNLRPLFRKLLVELKKLVILFIGPSFDFPFGDLLVFLLDLHVYHFAVLRDDGDDKLCLHFLL
jgi:hypothetical protein